MVDGQEVGIVSWGKERCDEAPGVYTEVLEYINWINKHINTKNHEEMMSLNTLDL
jgi:secreted trypsin-like serine protease